jgi:hypothetical protein
MKKLYLFIFIFSSFSVFSQIEGSWSLSPTAGCLGVGPDSASTSWWTLDADGVIARSCLIDDSIVFNSDGTYDHYMDGSTWLEEWQGADEACGEPISPHNGGTFDYTFENGVLTVIGEGAHIGLAKVHNNGEDGVPENNQISYSITFTGSSNEIMIVDINYQVGYWRYVYLKNGAAPPSDINVTFFVEVPSSVTVSSAIYVGGGVFGTADAIELNDVDGDGIWCGSAIFPPAGGNYVFLNSPNSNEDWGAKENLEGLSCADAGNWNDRIMPALDADISLGLTFGTCDEISIPSIPCSPTAIEDDFSKDLFSIYPNPNNGIVNISSDKQVSYVKIYNMIGNLVFEEKSYKTNSIINIQNFMNGIYFLELEFEDGSFNNTKLIKR